MSGGVSVRDRAAVYNLIVQPPRRIEPAEALLKTATGYWDVSNYTSGAQVVPNRGTGGSALDAQLGSTSSVDSNDPQFLAYSASTGSYVYLPGVAGNYLSVPDAANLRITGDIEMVFYVAPNTWTPGTQYVLAQRLATAGNYSYGAEIAPTGALRFRWSSDGTAINATISNAVVSFGADVGAWLKITFDVDNGASGRDAKFYTAASAAAEPSSWTQLGTTVTSAGATSIFAGTSEMQIGGGSGAVAAQVRRAIVRDGIGGTTVLDVDTSVLTSGAATSFNAATGQMVAINRSSSGRKAVAVVRPLFLFGTDDYLEVADNDLLDFGATEPFSVVAAVRLWSTIGASTAIVSKQNLSAYPQAGWSLYTNGTTSGSKLLVADGANGPTSNSSSAPASGAVNLMVGVREPGAGSSALRTYNNSTASGTATDSTTGSLGNSYAMRVGRHANSGTSYADAEFLFAAVFRRALSASEISMLATYAATRMP